MSSTANHCRDVNFIVMLLSFAAFASSTSIRICDPLLPIIASTFHVSTGQASSIITATNVGYGLSLIGIGPLGDRIDKYRLITFFSFACSLASLACALSPTIDLLVAARSLTGVFTAALIPLSMAWIGDNVIIEARQDTLARFMSGQIIGVVAGQVIGGFFADNVGWNNAFIFMSIVYLFVGLQLFKSRRIEKSLLRVLATETYITHGYFESIRTLVTNSNSMAVLLTVFLESVGVFGVLAFIPSYLHSNFSISLLIAGIIVSSFGVGGLFYSMFSRRLLRRLGRPGLVLVGGILMSCGLLLMSAAHDMGVILFGCVFIGLGFYMHHVTLQAEATQMLPSARGTAVALFASVFFIGQAVGVSLGAFVVDHYKLYWLFITPAVLLPIVALCFSRHLDSELAHR